MAHYELSEFKSPEQKTPLLEINKLESIHSSSSEISTLSTYQDYEYAPYELQILRKASTSFFKYRANALKIFSFKMTGTSYEIGPFLIFVLFSLGFIGSQVFYYSCESSCPNMKAMRKQTGALSSICFGISLTLACRNSIWAILLGIPFERALFWHKFFSYWGVVLGIGHAFIDEFHFQMTDWTGVALISVVGGMAVFSFFPIRRKFFRFFQVTHWLLFIACVICALLHEAGEVIIGSGFFALDLAIRFWIIRKNRHSTRKVRIEKLPFKVLKISLPRKNQKYKPGQYAFLCFPSISCYEFHPFSFSSSPSDEQIVFHIRTNGPWTETLYNSMKTTVNSELDMLIDGPYGNPAEFLDNSEVRVFLMVSGGIGITPLQSICRELLSQNSRGRPLHKIFFIWSVRDRNLLNSDEMGEFYRRDLPVIFQPDFFDTKENETLVCRFHLTQYRSESEFYKGNIHPSKQKSLRLGRPNLAEYLKEVIEIAGKGGKVGVLSCGPEHMMNSLREECWKLRDRGVELLQHEEVFEF